VILEAIQDVVETFADAACLLSYRLVCGLRMISGRNEAGNGRAERPDPYTVLYRPNLTSPFDLGFPQNPLDVHRLVGRFS
jgi:hypothetical protein